MFNPTPLHPIMVHFPIALAFVLPLLALIFSFFIKKGKFESRTWLVIAGLQIFTLVAGYAALQTGESDEEMIEHVTGKPPIHEHEERAEMFVAGMVAASAVATMAYFVRPTAQVYVQLIAVVLMVLNSFLAYRTGEAGGALVYKFGAANAYMAAQKMPAEQAAAAGNGLLPTPDLNTSESSYPTETLSNGLEESEDVEPETPIIQ